MKEIIYSKNAPKPIGPYSQAVMFDNIIFISGQLPIDPKTGNIETENINLQTLQIFKNLDAILNVNKINFDNILKVTVYITDLNNFKIVNDIYSNFFKKNPPARSTVQVSGLPLNSLLEIEAIAYVE